MGLAAAAGAQSLPANAAGPAAVPASPEVAGRGVLPEVLVTAQRRSENIQKSSLAIQALSADTLRSAGVSQAQDLTTVVPGLQISQYGPIVQTFIRGVGDAGGNPVSVSPVAFNVDGVYVARPESIGTNFYDLERVEVLKGPQGTLYGRNASGGAINLITRGPVLGRTEGFATFEVGNLDMRHVEAAVNIPLGDTVAVRAAFNLMRRDGYLSDGGNDDDQTEGRIRVLWKPSERISLRLNADFAHVGGQGGGFTYLPKRPGASDWEGTLDPAAQAYLLSRLPIAVTSTKPFQDGDFQNVSAELAADLGFATLTVLPAYRHTKYENSTYSGFVDTNVANSDQTSVEARLSHANDWLKWVAGLYYFQEKENAETSILISPFIQNVNIFFRPDTTSYAAFGEGTLTVLKGLRIIGGLRYTSDKRSLDGHLHDNIFDTNEPFSGEKTFPKVTWKAGAEYDVSPRNLLFFTASTGFKSGGINQEIAPNVFQPEVLTAYEFGSRNRFLNNRLQVNFELFYWEYTNKQETTIALDNSFTVNLLILNSGSATMKGANLDVVFRPTNNDTFQFSLEYNDAKYDNFVYNTVNSAFGVQFFNPGFTGCAIGPIAPGPIGSTQRAIDCSGFRLPRDPEWTGSAGYSHIFNLANGAEIRAAGDLQFATWRFLSTAFNSSSRAPGYVLANANLTYTLPNKSWSFTAFGHNLTNETVYQGGFANPYTPNLLAATINPPRTYGVRMTYKF